MIPAREYLRVSVDRFGDQRSTDQQHTDNLAAAEREGFTLGEPYRDDDRSASRYATRVREDFGRLVADLAAGRFSADVLVLWEASRGSRRVGEWVELIEACETAGVSVYVTTHGRRYDPANPRDRRTLLEDAVDSEYESAKTSQRILRSIASSAAAGRPHGRVPYGFRRVYDDRTGGLVAQEPDPIEAPVVVELFERIHAGHTLISIARDFADRGIVSRNGTPFAAPTLRGMAMRESYAGLRSHHGQIVEGTWDGIVSRELFLAVRRILTDPSRRTNRPGRAVHFLSMIARCDVCGKEIVARAGGVDAYACRRGHVHVQKSALDEIATAAILGYVTRPDNRRWLERDNGPELAKIREQIAAIEIELDQLADQVASGALSATFAARVVPGLEQRLADAREREDALRTPPVLRGLLGGPDADVAARWAAAPMSARRDVARLILSPEHLGELRVAPEPYWHAPAGERLIWRRED